MAGDVLVGLESPSQERANAEHVEEIARHAAGHDTLGCFAVGQVDRRELLGCHLSEGRSLIAPIAEVACRHASGLVVPPFDGRHDPIGMGPGEWTQHNAVNSPKDCYRRANAECKREDGRCGESRRGDKQSDRLAHILSQLVEV